MSMDVIRGLAFALPALLFSLSVHEYAHAFVATKLGDSTPSRQNRLTLNPVSHIDPLGTLLLPALMLLLTAGGSVFGWAKPVQFQPHNFTRKLTMRQGTALTAIAGPLSNVLLALLTMVILRVAATTGMLEALPDKQQDIAIQFASTMVGLNILLAVFNMLPIPPLDGSHLLPASFDNAKVWISRYALLIFLVLFMFPLPGLGRPLGSMVMEPLIRGLQSFLSMIAYAGAGT